MIKKIAAAIATTALSAAVYTYVSKKVSDCLDKKCAKRDGTRVCTCHNTCTYLSK